MSDTCYYAYCLHVRDGPQPPLFYGGKLFQQFVVDAQANCEQRKLNWTRTHQHTLRSELYQGLQDAAVHDRHDGEDIGPLGHKLVLEGQRAAITVGTNDGPLTGLSNRY